MKISPWEEKRKKERSTCDRCTSGKWVVALQGGVEISQSWACYIDLSRTKHSLRKIELRYKSLTDLVRNGPEVNCNF